MNLFLSFVIRLCFFKTALSIPYSCVVTCWKRADLLTLLCVMVFLVFLSLSHVVFWVRCGA